jgi:2-methylcitrate dehydratase PrpD
MTTPQVDLIQPLAHNVVNTRFERLPGDAVKYTKLGFLDTIGVMLAGSQSAGCQAAIDLVKQWGGKKESTILIHGGKVPSPNAALVNSVMARALDFDYVYLRGMHLGASSIPTALAVAERQGGVSGKEFLAAVIAGEDLALRIHLATAYTGFDPSGVCMVFGTAAIAAKLLGATEEQMLDALGLAFHRAAGSFQANIDGSLAVRFIQGFTSKNGVEAALLAQRGITGGINILQGVWGYFNLFSKAKLDPQQVLTGLGQNYWGSTIWFKRFPSCGATLAATDATLALVSENNINPDEIKEVNVKFFGESSLLLVGKPFESRRYPQVDAQFNVRYCVASAIVRKDSRLEYFRPESVSDRRVQALVTKVNPTVDKEVKEMGGLHGSTIVEIVMNDGKQYRKYVKYTKGLPDNPLSEEEIRRKFDYCLKQAPVTLPDKNINRIVKMVDHLEDVADVTDIIDLLVVS